MATLRDVARGCESTRREPERRRRPRGTRGDSISARRARGEPHDAARRKRRRFAGDGDHAAEVAVSWREGEGADRVLRAAERVAGKMRREGGEVRRDALGVRDREGGARRRRRGGVFARRRRRGRASLVRAPAETSTSARFAPRPRTNPRLRRRPPARGREEESGRGERRRDGRRRGRRESLATRRAGDAEIGRGPVRDEVPTRSGVSRPARRAG